MTNSISSGSRNRLLGVVVACVVLGVAGAAHADRKRVVVLEFEGPRAEKFHDDLVRIIKKSHTVVSTDKWNGAAEEMNAATVSDKNIKKVANKLKIDAVIEGKIEKRRDDFLIRLTLHDGKSGELVGNPVATKAEGPRIDGRAQREIKEELVDAIENVESNHAAVVIEDDEDERPVPAAKPSARKTDDEDERPVRRGFARLSEDERGADRVDRKSANTTQGEEDDEDKLPPRKRANKAEDDDDEGNKPPPRKRANKAEDDEDDKLPPRRNTGRKVASRDDVDDGAELEDKAPPISGHPLSAGERALDAVAGVSVTMRRMTFAYRGDLLARPAGYKGRPVGGAMVDATLYPLALGHNRADIAKDIGLHVMYDRVLFINSRDPMTGTVHATKESRYSVGGVVRRALWDSPRAMVVAGSLDYSRQVFTISGQANVPSVQYSIFEPGAALRVPVTSKIMASVEAKVMIVTSAGRIEATSQYGDTTALGVEGAFAIDYLITRNVFARAAFRAETIRLTFEGNGDLATMRDGDPMTQDVSGARDSYFGGLLTAGYLY